MRVYTCDGALITAAWGQDPTAAGCCSPYLDMGTGIPPNLRVELFKTAVLSTDIDGDGLADAGDQITYKVTVINRSLRVRNLVALDDSLPVNTNYEIISTTRTTTDLSIDSVTTISIPDDTIGTAYPLDSGGIVLGDLIGATQEEIEFIVNVEGSSDDLVSNTAVVTTSQGETFISTVSTPRDNSFTQCDISFTDNIYASVSSYLENSTLYFSLTAALINTSSSLTDSLSVNVDNVSGMDCETVTLVETGINTGIFQGSIGSSSSSGESSEDGILKAEDGDSLSVLFIDATYGYNCMDVANITMPIFTKPLYLSSDSVGNPDQDLDRVHPGLVSPVDNTTDTTGTLSVSGGGSGADKIYALRGNDKDDFYEYDISANSWTSKADVPTKVKKGGALAYDGTFIYATDGEKTDPSKFYRYDISTNLWTALADLPEKLKGGASLIHVGSKIYALRGDDEKNFYEYDISGNIWTDKADVTIDVHDGGALAYDGTYIYATDGKNSDPSKFYQHNISTDTWTTLADLPDKLSSGGALIYAESKIYALRGNDKDDFYEYDIAGNSWTSKADVLTKVKQGGALAFDGTYVYASDGDKTNPSKFYKYDIDLDTWSTMSSLPEKMKWGGALVGTGSGSSSGSSSQSLTFIQVPPICSDLSVPSGSNLGATLYINVSNGSMPANPDIQAIIKYGSTTLDTLSNPSYAGSILTFTGSLSSNVTVPAGDSIKLEVITNESGADFEILSDSQTYPSRIDLPTMTVISVDSLNVYDQPYSGGSIITSELNGTTVYIRAFVSDPFGAYDITSLDLIITDPFGGMDTVSAVDVVGTSGCTKIFEYEWQTPTQAGFYDLHVSAKEGYENTVADQANTPFELTHDDLGTPCALDFTDASYAPDSSYNLPDTVYVELIDADKDDDTGTAETVMVTITSTNGDSETITLTETGVSTGIFHGSIAATSSAPNPNNGTVNGAVGSALTLIYTDPEDPDDICTDNASFPVAAPSITLSKTLMSPVDSIANVGDPVQFRLVITNTGNTTISALILNDTYTSSCLTYESASTAPSTIGSDTLTWNSLSIPVAGNITIDVNFTGAGTAGCDPTTNSATTSGGGVPDQNDNAVVTITNPLASITKTRTSSVNADVGDTILFDVVVTNTGTTMLSTIPLTDDFSAFCMSFDTATSAGASYMPDGIGSGFLLWNNVGPLNASQSRTISLKFIALNGCVPATNEGEVSSVVDENGDDVPSVSDTDTVIILENPLIGLAKSLSSIVENGSDSYTITFLLTIENFGNVGLSDLKIFDDIVTQFLGYSPGVFSATDGSLTANVSWDGTSASNILASGQILAVGASGTVSVSFDITVLTSTTINNIATARGTSPIDEEVTDTSTDGLDPDDNDNDDNPDENTPTAVAILNDPPIAIIDRDTTNEDIAVIIVILTNDSDTDGNIDTTSVMVTDSASNGTVQVNVDGTITYTPDSNFNGLDTFVYKVFDDGTPLPAQCDTAFVYVVVTPVNDPPVITEVPQTSPEDTPITFCPTLSDPDTGDTLTMSICGGPQNGTGILVQMDTCITYTPTMNYTGPDTMCVMVCDQGGLCDSINVPIIVTPFGEPPIAENDTTTTPEDTPVVINILTNDSDPDGNLIGDSIRILTLPVNGDTSSVGDSLVTYTPDLNFTGIDSFQYQVCDTSMMGSQCDTAWVFITITPDTSFFDLAFRKTVTDLNRPVQWGDTLEFIFHVFNQGSEIVQNVELVDYLGDGFIFDTSLNSEWTLGTGNKIYSTIPDTILPGDSVMISLNLMIRVGTQEEDLINYGEVSDFEDKDGIGATDKDSTPDESNNNDGNVNDDAVDNSEGDEDDHDIALTPVFDLALRKTTVGGVVSVEIGDIVTYHIEIFNQGNIDARSVEVSDFPEDGLTFLPTENPDWKVVGNKYEYIPTLDIDVGAKADIYITLQVNNSANNSNILNQAEIINARDASGVNMSPFDIDSSPDDDFGNDVGGLPGSNSDNLISGIGIIDEDDHDPAPLNLCGQIACIEKINVSVKNSCSIKITPEMVLVDTFPFQTNHFDLEFFDLNGNEIDSIRINERMKVLVRVPNCVDAICWSEVLVEDKIAPTITCAPTDTILCNKIDTHVSPTVIDLCNQGIDIQLVVENFEKICFNDSIIGRTIKGFRAVDQSGNISNTCFDTTYIQVPNIANAAFPGDTILICNTTLNSIDSLKSRSFGVPTLNGLDLTSDSALMCSINASFEDIAIVDRPCKKQILRMWTVRQWLCNGTEKTREMPQLITLKDTISPQISILDTLVVKATNHECKATFNLPGLQVKDDCDNDPVIDISTPEGVVRYSQGELIQLSIDTHTLVIQAFDNCHNVSRDTFVVIIADHAPPVNLCLSHTTIALNDVGEALVDASVFDQGSFDGCSAVTFLARRITTLCTAADTSFGKTVKFCCEDINQNIMVQVQATDKSGNTSICMVSVTVQDKDLPALHCPPDITVNCNLIISDTTIFGNVTFEGQQKALLINPADVIASSKALTDGVAFGSCLDTIFLASTTANIDQCNAGTIKRVFTVRDMAGLESSCTQTITIIHDDNAPKPPITYPPDTTLVTCDSSMATVVVTGSPTAIEGRCNMIGFAFEDQIVTPIDTSDNVCLKIIRKWSVFEHCSTPFKLIDTHDQIIKLVKNQTNSFVIGGSVISLYDEAIAKVDVAIHDISENGLELEYTDNSGNYVFSSMPSGGTYSIKPHKNDDWPNGVSTLDMILIQNHILGKVKIEDGYNLVAADVNKDANVSAIDLVLLRRIILGLEDKVKTNTSWRFIWDGQKLGADYSLHDRLMDQYNLNSLNSNMTINWQGVKVGDLSGNAVANGLEHSESRGTQKLHLDWQVRKLGKEQIIDFYLPHLKKFNGIQGEVQLPSSLRLSGWIDRQIVFKSHDINYIEKENKVVFSHPIVNPMEILSTVPVYSWVVEGSFDSEDHELALTDKIAKAEVYNNMIAKEYALRKISEEASDFKVFQNRIVNIYQYDSQRIL